MESTGEYWIPVFNLLEDSINVTIANPKRVILKEIMPRIQSGLATCSESGLFPAALSRAGTPASCGVYAVLLQNGILL